MILSRSCEHAVRAILYLAQKPSGACIRISKIAREEKIPYYFLGKIFQNLARTGLLNSLKGRRGGFALARPASQITLLEVVEAVDGLSHFEHCVIGLPECGSNNACALHDRWKSIRSDIYDMLASQTISQLIVNKKRRIQQRRMRASRESEQT